MMLRQCLRSEKRNRALIKGALFFVVFAFMAYCARADVSPPDTPAGHVLGAFFDAFNSADHDRIAAYVKEYDPENNADGLTSFSNQTGGFTLVSIVHSAPGRLTFLVHGRGDNIDAYGVLQLAGTQPPRVKHLIIRALPPGAKLDDIQLDAAIRQKTIDAVSAKLTEYYVYPDVAAKMIKFGAFPPPDICAPTVVAAMNFVARTNALIFDLRENHGGDPAMVDFMVSYLFRQPTHINDLTNRHENETHQYWTLPWIPGPRLVDQPVYVLTSSQTFSGGEEFTFDLKTQKRATIVGETTGGGAHPVQGQPAGDHFTVGVPFGRPINPVTKGDWEGTGIEPDVKVSATDALTTAEKLAADKLASQSRPK
jgi:hypothetical protein